MELGPGCGRPHGVPRGLVGGGRNPPRDASESVNASRRPPSPPPFSHENPWSPPVISSSSCCSSAETDGVSQLPHLISSSAPPLPLFVLTLFVRIFLHSPSLSRVTRPMPSIWSPNDFKTVALHLDDAVRIHNLQLKITVNKLRQLSGQTTRLLRRRTGFDTLRRRSDFRSGKFSRGIPVSHDLAFRRCSIFTSLHPRQQARPRCEVTTKTSQLSTSRYPQCSQMTLYHLGCHALQFPQLLRPVQSILDRKETYSVAAIRILRTGHPVDFLVPVACYAFASHPRRTGFDSRMGRSTNFFARGNRTGRCRWSACFLGGLPLPSLHSSVRRSVFTSLIPGFTNTFRDPRSHDTSSEPGSSLILVQNVKVLHQRNFMILDLRFVDVGSKDSTYKKRIHIVPTVENLATSLKVCRWGGGGVGEERFLIVRERHRETHCKHERRGEIGWRNATQLVGLRTRAGRRLARVFAAWRLRIFVSSRGQAAPTLERNGNSRLLAIKNFSQVRRPPGCHTRRRQQDIWKECGLRVLTLLKEVGRRREKSSEPITGKQQCHRYQVYSLELLCEFPARKSYVGSSALAVSLLASHQGEPGPIPGRATPGF
ncbi:hypothetical protein PR048_022937 [Dryococelus australis]|uniref:Uncharacterized protein n=1 Tax=Dryococelus australis TaxID=614101 RepID=A0ABQ9GSQ6_9NEOP|nr:hypothetical protein PR048_022937 [Dryococelus australis]